jgi:hypothetical protein
VRHFCPGITGLLALLLVLASVPAQAQLPVISGLKLWLRGDAGVLTSGSSVTNWLDQSGNGNNATQGTGANQPTVVSGALNGLPVVRFDGINDWLAADGVTSVFGGNDSANTVFVVMKLPVTAGNNRDILGLGSSTDANPFYQLRATSGGDFLVAKRDDASVQKFVTAGATDTNPDVLSFVNSGTAVSAYKNGSQFISSFDINVGTMTVDLATIGAQRAIGFLSGVVPFHGDIAEMLIYDTALNSTDRLAVEQYLAGHWGLVPEPSVTVLLLTGGAVLWRKRHRG